MTDGVIEGAPTGGQATGGGAPKPVEIELKYRMTNPSPGERLLLSNDLAGLVALGPSEEVYQEDRYLDTADAALARAGYAGRLRRTEQGTVVTLKGLKRRDGGGAAHARVELEGPANPAAPVRSWPQSAARDTVSSIAAGRPLVELVVLRQRRRKRLYGREGVVVELSVDDVQVVSEGRIVDRFSELEAELVSGDEAALAPLADLLAEVEELVPSAASKLERALDSVRGAALPAADELGAALDAATADEDEEEDDESADALEDGPADAPDDLLVDEPASIAEVLAVGLEAHDDELDDGEDDFEDDDEGAAPDDDLLPGAADTDPFAEEAIAAAAAVAPVVVGYTDAIVEPAAAAAPEPGAAIADPAYGATFDVGAAATASTEPTFSVAASSASPFTPEAAAAPAATAPAPVVVPATEPAASTLTSPVVRAPDATPKPVQPPKAEPRLTAGKTPGVITDDHLAEAGRKVLRFHLARMVAREAGTREGKDAEELHAMRVATRRQRAAWRVFGDAFDQKRTARHQRRLKEVARDLGAVRDLDVLIEAAVEYQEKLSPADRPNFEPLIAKWRNQRDAARVVLIKELDSQRYQSWLDEYIAFVQAEGIGTRTVGPVEPHRVRDTMPSRIWAAYEALRAYEPVMRWADVTTLHDLRIAAKWLRYTLEFVREALGPDVAPVIERVVALQDHLGWLHDADVAAGLARGFLVEHAGDLSEAESAAIGRYLVDRERELARLRRTVGPTWRGVSSLGFRRALGRLVSGL